MFVLAGIAVFVLAGALVWRQLGPRALSAGDAEAKSIAVLSFLPAANDTAQRYLADGVSEDLTTALSRLPALRVAGSLIDSCRAGDHAIDAGRPVCSVGEAIDNATDMRAPLCLALYKRQIARNWLTCSNVEC